MYCPYHGLDHPSGTPFTPEHVIPYALGGANQFTIQVCQKINSDIGTQIDARFQSIFPVAFHRFMGNIKSYSGEEPSILFRGTTEINGKTMRISYEITQSDKSLKLVPSVETEVTTEGIRNHVQSMPDHFQKMIRNLDRKHPDRSFLDEFGNVTTLSELLARTTGVSTIPTIALTWNADDWSTAAKRELVKIALGTGHFFLGERYSRSDAADQLRRFLHATDDELPSIPIPGNTWPSQVGQNLPVIFRVATPDQHLVTLLHMDEKLAVFVSLFGEINGVIQIAADPNICKDVNRDDGFILTIDPKTRTFSKRTFHEFLKSLS